MKKVTRWFYILGIVSLLFVVCSMVFSIIHEEYQYFNDQNVASELTNVYVSETPFGDEFTSLVPGHTYYLNMESTRKRDCFAQINWYLVKKENDVELVFYDMNESVVFVTVANKKRIAEVFTVPGTALPGHYIINRVATYQCSTGGRSSAIISSAKFEVVTAQ